MLDDVGDLLIRNVIGERWHLRFISGLASWSLDPALRSIPLPQQLWHLTNYLVANSHLTIYGFITFVIWAGSMHWYRAPQCRMTLQSRRGKSPLAIESIDGRYRSAPRLTPSRGLPPAAAAEIPVAALGQIEVAPAGAPPSLTITPLLREIWWARDGDRVPDRVREGETSSRVAFDPKAADRLARHSGRLLKEHRTQLAKLGAGVPLKGCLGCRKLDQCGPVRSPLTPAVLILIVGLQDADKIGHAGSIPVFGDGRNRSVGRGLAPLPKPHEEIGDVFHSILSAANYCGRHRSGNGLDQGGSQRALRRRPCPATAYSRASSVALHCIQQVALST